MTLSIAIKVLDPRLEAWGFPRYGSEHAAGLDLYACLSQPLELARRGEAVLVPVGFAMQIGDPEWCGMILPRSGAGHHRGLILGNSVGLIDPDYTGEVLVSAWNRNQTGRRITIRPGERIAQLVFVRCARPRFEVVAEFPERSTRGDRGFGASGA